MPEFSLWQIALPSFAVALAFGYALGSIPFGLILTRAAGLGDIRAIGSGNIGATNVLRTGNKALAAGTLLLDALKGTLAVLVAAWFGPEAALVAGFGAFVGHLFPIWLGFKGGKGVATYLGVLLGLYWPAFVLFAVVWLALALAFRYSSLAALIASLAAPLLLLTIGLAPFAGLGVALPTPVGSPWRMGLVALAMAGLLWLRHRENIVRLLAGTEPRIGAKSAKPPS